MVDSSRITVISSGRSELEEALMTLVYVIAWAGVKFHEFKNGNCAIIAKRVEFIPKFHSCPCYHKLILLLLSLKSKYQTCFHDEQWLLAALLTLVRHTVKVENRSGLTFLCIVQWLTHFLAE